MYDSRLKKIGCHHVTGVTRFPTMVKLIMPE